ncbi:hypothetical protein JGU66_16060 [Myxococcaceae bacterium JPH2]|nr:hypothetical protein [Myxococcaceae bacterium JPH2]
MVTTLAGSTTAGSANGTGAAASFKGPMGIATDSQGNVYVAEFNNHLIRKITPAGVVTTLAGSGSSGSSNGMGTAASFNSPSGVAVDASGNVYVADSFNGMIRKITPAGMVSTMAGSTTPGNTNATGTAASFRGPLGVAVDASGNVYVADSGNKLIRKITPAGVVSTLAGSGEYGSTNGTGTAASFSGPRAVAVDSSGNVYVAEPSSNLIRKVTAAGVVSTLVGTGAVGSADGTGTAASFADPMGVTVDASGNVFVSSIADNLIRKVTSAGVVTTLAGKAGVGSNGSADGTGAEARFNLPQAVTVDASGNLYVADYGNNMIRKLRLP